ncbi:hypothetical protein F5Y16DRAFT_399831 [Xylariaceae sp. FL0255]|nr:hypothetical protein F5Y16DRAFT_399831 [Xylariaceae sp. FL0255]
MPVTSSAAIRYVSEQQRTNYTDFVVMKYSENDARPFARALVHSPSQDGSDCTPWCIMSGITRRSFEYMHGRSLKRGTKIQKNYVGPHITVDFFDEEDGYITTKRIDTDGNDIKQMKFD